MKENNNPFTWTKSGIDSNRWEMTTKFNKIESVNIDSCVMKFTMNPTPIFIILAFDCEIHRCWFLFHTFPIDFQFWQLYCYRHVLLERWNTFNNFSSSIGHTFFKLKICELFGQYLFVRISNEGFGQKIIHWNITTTRQNDLQSIIRLS